MKLNSYSRCEAHAAPSTPAMFSLRGSVRRLSSATYTQKSCVAARPATDSVESSCRRTVLFGLGALLTLPARDAKAGFGWDGKSSALGSCALGEEGDDCRRQQLLRDAGKQKPAYPTGFQEGRPQASSTGLPIAVLGDEYTRETTELGEKVDLYFTLDTFDPERSKLIKDLKKEGATWAAKYARGGSVRKPSARKFYIVIDSLQGFITSNGFAPFPKQKAAILQKDIAATRELLAKGS